MYLQKKISTSWFFRFSGTMAGTGTENDTHSYRYRYCTFMASYRAIFAHFWKGSAECAALTSSGILFQALIARATNSRRASSVRTRGIARMSASQCLAWSSPTRNERWVSHHHGVISPILAKYIHIYQFYVEAHAVNAAKYDTRSTLLITFTHRQSSWSPHVGPRRTRW